MKDPNADISDLEMMLNPDRWPNYVPQAKSGLLPLKNPDAFETHGFSEAGFGILISRFIDGIGWQYVWEWKAKIHSMPVTPSPDHIAQGGQELIRLLVQCGWVVD